MLYAYSKLKIIISTWNKIFEAKINFERKNKCNDENDCITSLIFYLGTRDYSGS